MIIADMAAIGLIALLGLVGSCKGFGGVLRGIVNGVVGKVTACALTYFLYDIVLDISFVKSLIARLVDALSSSENAVCKILLAIRIDMIVVISLLYLLIYLLLKMSVGVVAGVFESKMALMTLCNKFLGMVVLLVYAAIWLLILFQILAWVFGTGGGIYPYLSGSLLKLDELYVHNPLNAIFETIKHSLSGLAS